LILDELELGTLINKSPLSGLVHLKLPRMFVVPGGFVMSFSAISTKPLIGRHLAAALALIHLAVSLTDCGKMPGQQAFTRNAI
jgi:hypothetical protein